MEIMVCVLILKPKTFFPLLKVNKTNFFWKLIKNQIELHHPWCHGDGAVKFKVAEARKIVRNKKMSPGRHQAEYQAQISTTDSI